MIQNIRRSLTDLLGSGIHRGRVPRARGTHGESPEALRAVADEKVDFYPEAFARRQEELMATSATPLRPLLQTLRTARPPIHTVPPSTALQLRWAGWALPHRRGRPPVFRGQKRALPDSPGTRLSRLLAY